MPASLKNLFDRLVYLFMEESPRGIPRPRLKGKRAVIVAACTTPWPFNRIFRQSGGTVRAIREILKTGGYCTRNLQIGGTKNRKKPLEKYETRLSGLIRKAERKLR